jgi:hypothetical protein
MAKAKQVESKEVITEASAEALAALAAMFPQEDVINRRQFPKLTFKSQTVLDEDEETILVKAGTFFIERPTDEEEDGKKVWEKVELGKELDGHIILHRKKLQYWDADNEEFISSPIFDDASEMVSLFKSGDFVTSGTVAELKSLYPETKKYIDKKSGEEKEYVGSKLKDATVLYVLVAGELLELTIQGTSRKSWLGYLKTTAVPTVITHFTSTPQKVGSTKWNQMEFKASGTPSADQASLGIATLTELLEGIRMEKEYYAKKQAARATVMPATEPAALPAGDTTTTEEDDGF